MNKKQLKEHMKKLGEAGGQRTAELYGKSHFSKIGKEGQKALRKKLLGL